MGVGRVIYALLYALISKTNYCFVRYLNIEDDGSKNTTDFVVCRLYSVLLFVDNTIKLLIDIFVGGVEGSSSLLSLEEFNAKFIRSNSTRMSFVIVFYLLAGKYL